MSALDYIVALIVAIILIVGAYQFYFLPQRKPLRKSFSVLTSVDQKIPFKPQWVWIYSALYYPIILLLVLTVGTFREFNYVAFSFIFLLAMHLIIFYLVPIHTPDEWREYIVNKSISTKFLNTVQKYDSPLNCFPSMHVSVATLTAFHLFRNLEPHINAFSNIAFFFPILISISALFTKQHYIIDIPCGFVLGYLTYKLFVIIFT